MNIHFIFITHSAGEETDMNFWHLVQRSNKSILKKSVLNIHWKDWCWSWSSNTLATWCKEPTHWKRPRCWERSKAGGDGDDRGWDSWIAPLTQWTEFEQALRDGEGQGSLACCSPWGCRVRHNWMTEPPPPRLFNWEVAEPRIRWRLYGFRASHPHPPAPALSTRPNNQRSFLSLSAHFTMLTPVSLPGLSWEAVT